MPGKSLSRLTRTGPEAEKVTINLGFVDLGQIDLLVNEGFYSNRTDFIRTAIRQLLSHHADTVRDTVSRKTLALGLSRYSRADLEAVRAAGQKLQVRIVGMASIDGDVPPELVRDTIESMTVLGVLDASAAVKAALADRLR